MTKSQIVMVIESMKMEYAISAKTGGTIKAVLVAKGELVEEGDL